MVLRDVHEDRLMERFPRNRVLGCGERVQLLYLVQPRTYPLKEMIMGRVRSFGTVVLVFLALSVLFFTGAVRGAPMAAQQSSQGMATPEPTPPVTAGGTLPGNPAI